MTAPNPGKGGAVETKKGRSRTVTTIATPGDFFNRRDALSGGAPIPGARRHPRPRALDRTPTAAELAARVLSRRYRLTRRHALLIADLASIGREALS